MGWREMEKAAGIAAVEEALHKRESDMERLKHTHFEAYSRIKLEEKYERACALLEEAADRLDGCAGDNNENGERDLAHEICGFLEGK